MTRSRAQDEEVRNKILRRLVGDAEAGALGSLEHYLAEYCGHEELVRDEYCILSAQREATHPEAVSTGGPGERVARQAKGGFFDEVLRRLSGRRVTFERYTLKGEVGSGGQGTIMRIFDEDLRRHLAMKVLRQQVSEPPKQAKESVDTRSLAQFLEEAQVTAQLDHPGIVPVHELGLDAGGRLYFTMKLVKGQTLKEVFDLVREEKEGWTRTRALGVLSKVCEAMAYAHDKGVIHRDLKPSNVMVGKYGEVYVMDWGLARVLDQDDKKDVRIRPEEPRATSLLLSDRAASRSETPESPLYTMDGDVVGTPSYMSPEQARGDLAQMGPHSDVYALGAMLYHLLASHMPYVPLGARLNNYAVWSAVQQGPPPPIHGLARDAPAELVAICEKSMAREIGERYRDMSELARDLAAFLEGRVVAAYRTGAWAETKKWVLRNKALAGSLAAAVLLLALGLTASLILKARSDHNASVARANEERALAGEALATQQRALANEKAAEAERRTREARYQAYLASIRAAGSAHQLAEAASLRRFLEEAPEEHRNWEWRYLDALSDTSLLVLRGHGHSVLSAVFSPDGTRVATASDDARLWDAESGAELAVLRGHGGTVTSVAFDHDGTRVATAGIDKTARVWDARSGGELVVFRGHTKTVSSVAFSPDGSRITTASADGTARLWDAFGGAERAVLAGHTASVTCAVFSPDGGRVATAGLDKTARLWDAQSGTQLAVLHAHSWVQSVAFSPDGTRVATASSDAQLWDLANGAEAAVFRGHGGALESVAFSPDGTRIATSSYDGTARFWDAMNGAELGVLRGHECRVRSVAFSPDGGRVVTASDDRTARLWDSGSSADPTALGEHEDAVNSVVFSPDGMRLATASADRTARLWDALRRSELAVLRGHRDSVFQVAFSRDGSCLATASADKTARLWDAASAVELAVLRGHGGPVHSLAFSPDGRRVATASNDGTARLWDTASGAELAVLRGHELPLTSVAFDPGGTRVATASNDGTARLWDASSGAELSVLQGGGALTSLAFSPDGTRVATASPEGSTRLWGVETGAELLVLPEKEGSWSSRIHLEMSRVSFSPDGTLVATASADRTARLWNASSGVELAVLGGHEEFVNSVAFSPDGSRLATTSGDKTARLWDTSSGAEVAVLRGHEGLVASLAFSPDGTQIATASWDKTVRLWDSVPYSSRARERQQLDRAESAARSALEVARATSVSWTDTAERIRSDARLDPTLHRAVLDLLVREANGLSAQAWDWVVALRHALVLHDDVVAAVQADTVHPAEVRAEALRLALELEDVAFDLNAFAWGLLTTPEATADDYARALRAAQAAASMSPEDGAILNTLGVAEYRNGLYERALVTLTRSDQINGGSQPTDAAFLALAHRQLGHVEEARAALERLRLQMLGRAGDDEAFSVLRETEALIEGSSAPSGDDR